MRQRHSLRGVCFRAKRNLHSRPTLFALRRFSRVLFRQSVRLATLAGQFDRHGKPPTCEAFLKGLFPPPHGVQSIPQIAAPSSPRVRAGEALPHELRLARRRERLFVAPLAVVSERQPVDRASLRQSRSRRRACSSPRARACRGRRRPSRLHRPGGDHQIASTAGPCCKLTSGRA